MTRIMLWVALGCGLSASSWASPYEQPASDDTPTADTSDDTSDDDAVFSWSRARVDAERAHLGRLAIWAGCNLVAGGGLLVLATPGLSPVPAEHVPTMLSGVALQSLAWGAINLAIVGIGAAFPSSPTTDRGIALAAEDDLGKVLWTNIGLDAGYMFAGGSLMAASAFGAEPAIEWRSHGAGIVTQGAGLLALDLIAVWDSGPREEALQALPTTSSLAITP
jgi:hypothetical protein